MYPSPTTFFVRKDAKDAKLVFPGSKLTMYQDNQMPILWRWIDPRLEGYEMRENGGQIDKIRRHTL